MTFVAEIVKVTPARPGRDELNEIHDARHRGAPAICATGIDEMNDDVNDEVCGGRCIGERGFVTLVSIMMAKVKICGVTNARDAIWAARCGADALGFNFVPGTPRCCDPGRVKPIVMELPPFVSAVGVFANARPERVREITEQCDLDYVQLHGRESASECARLRDLRVIKAFRIREEEDLRDLQRYDVQAYLLDAYVEGKLGGTGESFRWEIARGARRYGQVILAGGLSPDNVATAIRAARPYAVDAASGVEEDPRNKDRDLVKNFIRSAKSVDV